MAYKSARNVKARKEILCTKFRFAVNDFIVGADAFDDVTGAAADSSLT